MKNQEIVDKIRILCIKKNTNLQEIAGKLGFTAQNLSQKLNRTGSTKVEFLEDVAKVLNCEVQVNFIDPDTKEILA